MDEEGEEEEPVLASPPPPVEHIQPDDDIWEQLFRLVPYGIE